MTQTITHDTFPSNPNGYEQEQTTIDPVYARELGYYGVTMAEEAAALRANGVTAVSQTSTKTSEPSLNPIDSFKRYPGDFSNAID